MWKLIIGSLIGAAIVNVINAGKLDGAADQINLMERKYEEEKQRRRYSENEVNRFKSENSKLMDELAFEREHKASIPTQKPESVSSKTVVLHKKTQTVIQKNAAVKVEDFPIRCIRL